jgi:hypothetical protein
VGLFLIEPSAVVSTVALQDQDIGDLVIRGLTGRPAVDVNGTVAFLAKTGVTRNALVRRRPDGAYGVLAMVDAPGPEGGEYRSLSRPAISPNGHIAYRGGFDRASAGTTAYFLVDDTDTPRSLVQIGEGDADGGGGRFSSLSPSAALNSSDHLAFIATTTAGKTRNGIFLASPTRTTVERLDLRVREPRGASLFGELTVRGQATLIRGDLGQFDLANDSVSVTVSDAGGLLYSGSLGKKSLARSGKVWVSKRRGATIRGLSIRRLGRDRIRLSFRSARVEYRGAFIQPPLTVRLDVGSHGGVGTIECSAHDGGATCRP